MSGLFLKDIMNLKQQAKLFFIAAIMYVVISFMKQDSSIFSVFMVVFTVMIPMTAFAYDDKAKWDRYALTMPVSRREIVFSKYLLVFAFALIAFLLSLFVSLWVTRNFHDSLTSSLTLFLVNLVLTSIVLPIFFKFGTEKGRIVLLALILIPTFVSLFASKLNLMMPDAATVHTLLSFAPFAGILIIVLSVFLSIKIYTHKEF